MAIIPQMLFFYLPSNFFLGGWFIYPAVCSQSGQERKKSFVWGAFGGGRMIRCSESQPATIKSTCLVANANRPEDSVFPVSPHHTVVHTTKNTKPVS